MGPPPPPPSSSSPAMTQTTALGGSKLPKRKGRRRRRNSNESHSSLSRTGSSSSSGSVAETSSESYPSSARPMRPPAFPVDCSPTATRLKDGDRGWDARRRDPRANGADIYVARFTKNGMGSAKPCWRCLEWCRWAGVKRIFHWNADENRFEVVKVNNADSGQYETHADIRLFAGLVRPSPVLVVSSR